MLTHIVREALSSGMLHALVKAVIKDILIEVSENPAPKSDASQMVCVLYGIERIVKLILATFGQSNVIASHLRRHKDIVVIRLA